MTLLHTHEYFILFYKMETDNLLNQPSSHYSDKSSINSISSGNFVLTNLNDRYYFGYNLKRVVESDEE